MLERLITITIKDEKTQKEASGNCLLSQLKEMADDFGLDGVSILISKLNEELDKELDNQVSQNTK